ncbi:MAG: hypothetical protein M3Y56_10625 [Armatimonadota bacterium]|nr:hypothetical protein [Armatimonadota bacterium]
MAYITARATERRASVQPRRLRWTTPAPNVMVRAASAPLTLVYRRSFVGRQGR